MPELSNLLKDRLSRAGKPEVHPDTDLLTAYAEKSLPNAERAQVMDHLSRCGACRDVVFLMTEPAAEEAPVISLVPAKRRIWFLTPQFGMVAAMCAMALGIGAIVRMQTSPTGVTQNARLEQTKEQPKEPSKTQPQTEAKAEPKVAAPAGSRSAANESAGNGAVNQTPAAQAEKGSAKSKDAEAARSADSISGPAGTTPAGVAVGGNLASAAPAASRNAPSTLANDKKADAATGRKPGAAPSRHDYVNLQLFASDASYQSGTDLPAAPSAPTVTSLTQATIMAREQHSGFADLRRDMEVQNQGTLTLYRSGAGRQTGGFIGRIADLGKRAAGKTLGPAIPLEATRSFAMATPPPVNGLDDSDALSAKPRAKSETLGESTAFSVNGLRSGVYGDTANPQWKVEKGKLLKLEAGSVYTEAAGGTDMEFSVVTANGSDVWAGGRRAALMHSADNGATWDKISLGEAASGTVVNIAASGANVVVKTSSNQTWSTQDGGKSWNKN